VQLNEGGVRQLKAKKIFINTGARPIVPSIGGLDDVPFLDSTSIMELGTIPEQLVVLGGGYIGLEFGQMFRRFGSEVTIIQRSGRLLTREDTDVAEEVAKILSGEGMKILLNTTPNHIKRAGNKKIHITVEDPDGEKTITCSHLLIATGRMPNSDNLNLESAGIETDDRGYIKVNNRLETNIDGVYAFGDVKGGPAFTHISYDDYRVIRANLLDEGNASTDGRLIPSTIFIDPQLGRVGLTEGEAKEQGYDFRIAKLPMSHVARALEIEETNGFMKAIVESRTGQILGCAILGYEGGEVMNMLQIAMMGKLPYTALRDTAFAHPTLGESLNNLFMTLDK
jgi:pyruvate/2-oxoglutarate dehydrogenase complex dihydrolipoamide dehydrogenase (E3) component